MAAAAVRGGWPVRRMRLLAALALLAALSAAPALRLARAAEDQKVWRALTEEDRRGRTPAAAPGGRGRSGAPASRDASMVYVAAGVLVAVFAGIVVARLVFSRRRRQAPALPRPADLEEGSEIERVWSHHLTRKKRERGPTV